MNEALDIHVLDCGHGAVAPPVEETRRRILADVMPVLGIEKNRTAQRPRARPGARRHLAVRRAGHTNSAVDGYALAAHDLPANGERELQIIGTAWTCCFVPPTSACCPRSGLA